MSPDLPPLRVLDALPVLVWAAGPDGGLTYVNHRVAEYAGIPADDLLGWDWKWVVHPDDLPDTLDRWGVALRSRRAQEVEHRLRRADGQYRWFLTRAEPTADADGRVVGWVGTGTDVDDARRAGDAARADRRLVRAAVERAAAGFALVGADGTVLYVSPPAAAALGLTPAALVGTPAAGLLHRDDRRGVAGAASDLAVRPGQRAEADVRLRHADGAFRRFRLRATNLLPDPDVRAIAVVIEAPAAAAPAP